MKIQRYSAPAMILHWLQAVLVIWLLWLGWTMVELPKGQERSAAFVLHKSLGILAFLIVLVRLQWRWFRPSPPLAATGREAVLASLAHRALYAFLLLAPMAGYLSSSFTTYAIKFFGIELPKAGWPNEALNGVFKELHEGLVWFGAGLIVLHLAGVIVHGLRRDGTLSRMLPSGLSRD